MDKVEQFNLPKSYIFKYNEDSMLITMLSPVLLVFLAEMQIWAKINDLPWVYTRTVSKKLAESTTDIHSSGRAADISVKGWNIDKINEFCDYFNSKYAKKYGTSKAGKNLRVCLYEDGITAGNAPHLHIQVRMGLSIAEFQKEYYNNIRRTL